MIQLRTASGKIKHEIILIHILHTIIFLHSVQNVSCIFFRFNITHALINTTYTNPYPLLAKAK